MENSGDVGSSTDMRDASHNGSFLHPCIHIDPFLFDSVLGRLLKGILSPGADIPDMSYHAEGSFAKFLPEEDWSCAQRACSTSRLGFRALCMVKSTEEVRRIRCPLMELVDVVDVE